MTAVDFPNQKILFQKKRHNNMQRFFDIFFSGFALLLLSPFFLPVMIVLKITGEREIFYIQERIGKDGKPFGLYKFATMLKNSPNIGAGDITLKNDSRVLPVGRFLRKTKINELPQLLNIIRGDMSIVGPRPMVSKTYKQYGNAGKDVYTIRPGLTGIGSIVFRDEERYLENRSDPMKFYVESIIPYKIQLELWYKKNKSLLMYFTIIFLTAWIVIFSDSRLHHNIFKDLPEKPDSLNIT